jgi:hypothetical protein
VKRRTFLLLLPFSCLAACHSSEDNSKKRSSRATEIGRFSLDTTHAYFATAYLKYSGLTSNKVIENFLSKFPNGFETIRLNQIIKSEYLANNIVHLDGWILSITEAESCIFFLNLRTT